MTEDLITQSGLERLIEELEQLMIDGRRKIAERIGQAATTDANLAENADYLDALGERTGLERRIAILARRIACARVVEADSRNGVVDVGERVGLRDIVTGEKVAYHLVGSFEADPFAGRISAASPLGRAVLGRRRGDVAVVEAPKGVRRLKIISIESVADPRRAAGV